MSPGIALFLLVVGLALLVLPRRWASLPLLVGACYMTRSDIFSLGPFSLTVLRILIAVGLVRVVIRREWRVHSLNGLEWTLVAWGLWMVISVAFHTDPSSQVVLRLRNVYDAWGLYILFRVFCRSREDMVWLAQILALVFGPIAILMLVEKSTGHNLFGLFGGTSMYSEVRLGTVRAMGPFAHSILAGTTGAVALPLVMALWGFNRPLALAGSAACIAMVYASGSSGPVLSMLAGIGSLCLWRYREQMHLLRWAALAFYITLDLVMNRPAYYVLASAAVVSGSTGWHRARLIESAFAKLGEWWLVGTDYTRHWMASGVTWSPNHTDITNHYIGLGVQGGLPLMLLFIWILVKGFSGIGHGWRSETRPQYQWLVWSAGAALLAQALTCISVSYFDQSIIFLYLTFAVTSAAQEGEVVQEEKLSVPATVTRPRLNSTLAQRDPGFGRVARPQPQFSGHPWRRLNPRT